MTAIKSWNRQQVHHGQHYRQQSQNIKETEPVPLGGEGLADGYEAADALVSLRAWRRHQPEVFQVTAYGAECQFETGRNGFRY